MRNGGRPFALSLLAAATIFTAACGGGSDDDASPAAGGVTKDQAYEMAVQGVRGDPAITEGLPLDTFDSLSRLTCEQLQAGSSVQKLVDDTAQQPTRSGMPLRRESAQALVSASVRGYCPEYASQLP